MERTAVIVVLYKPTEAQLNYWANILPPPICKNKLSVVLVDNTPEGDYSSYFEHSVYIPLRENKGIATAQNIGIAKAREIGAEFVIFFDQDSQCEPSLIDTLKQEFTTLRDEGIKIAAIGPLILDKSRGVFYTGNSVTDRPTAVELIISSGMFTTMSVLEDIGGMADNLFIDLVDLEWDWRAKKLGYKIYKSGDAILPHQIGVQMAKIMGRLFLIAAPIRYYYQYRNVLWLCKLDYVPMSWKIYRVRWLFLYPFIIPWHTGQPLKTLLYMLKGAIAGLFGRLKLNSNIHSINIHDFN